METKIPDHSLVALIRELREELTTLMRQEIALAKAEISEKASRAARNAAFLAAGVVLAGATLIMLLLGVRDLLSAGLINAGTTPQAAAWLSSFIVAILLGIVSWALVIKGKKALTNEGLAPTKTIASLREDRHLIKQKLART